MNSRFGAAAEIIPIWEGMLEVKNRLVQGVRRSSS